MKKEIENTDLTGWIKMWIIHWMEHEGGWGNSPGGVSLHLSIEDALEYEYKNFLEPDSLNYDYPVSIPRKVYVSPSLFKEFPVRKSTKFDEGMYKQELIIYMPDEDSMGLESDKYKNSEEVFKYYRSHNKLGECQERFRI